VRRIDGAEKVSGALTFTEDLQLTGLAYAKLVLSYTPRATIRAINSSLAESVPGVLAVVTGGQLEQLDDSPLGPMAVHEVRYVGQPVAAVIATSPAIAADAAELVEVEYEPLPAAISLEHALRNDAPRVLPGSVGATEEAATHGGAATQAEVQLSDRIGNITGRVMVDRGDLEIGFAAATVVEKRSFKVAAVHHAFLETHGVTADVARDGSINVWSPTQGMKWAHNAVVKSLHVNTNRVRITPMPVGGGFGGKITQLEPLVAQLAKRALRPIRLQLTRSEEFLVGWPAPASEIALELGATSKGELTALSADITYDNGATQGWHGGITAELLSSTYRVPNFRIRGKEVATNKIPTTAYRAPGAQQAFFALESCVDELARKLGLDPIELRLRNAASAGDLRGSGAVWPRIGFVECLEAARTHPAYRDPKSLNEGVGVAAGAWMGGFGAAAAACRVETDGSLSLHVGTSDISGTDTGFVRLAAETFGTSVERVRVYRTDSLTSPVAPVAGGSATTYSVASAVRNAVLEARRQLLDVASTHLEAAPDDLEVIDDEVRVRGVHSRIAKLADLAMKAEAAGGPGPIHAVGRVSVDEAAPMFTVHVARVLVDIETGAVRVLRYAVFQDVGHAICPDLIAAQIHGGVMQGLGRALGEELVWDTTGQLRTASFVDYLIPSTDLTPETVEVTLLEVPSEHGALGVRGVGEPPAIPGLAAVANAIRDAVGIRLTHAPFTLESIAAAPATDLGGEPGRS
jgi:CO/xanthine dehydrogenase Mo-binding subunit